VLRYLPTNLSRPGIACELSLSPNTVNTHMRSIYAKLGVRDRGSAVLRARALRLLGARPHEVARRSSLFRRCQFTCLPSRRSADRFVM